jgi:hypothetical protein
MLRPRSGRKLRIVVTTLMAVGLTVVAQAGGLAQAGATVERSLVTVGQPGVGISWRAPAASEGEVSVFNNSGEREASTVLVLDNGRAPSSFHFDVNLLAGMSLALEPDGSITVSKENGPVGSFRPPWARDATGRALATRYRVIGRSIEQKIDTSGAVYPVTADPKYTTGYVTGTVYFKKSETKVIASSLTYATVLCGAAAALVGGPTFAAGCAVAALQMNAQARTAVSRNQCVKLKVLLFPTPVYTGTYLYGGGYCT